MLFWINGILVPAVTYILELIVASKRGFGYNESLFGDIIIFMFAYAANVMLCPLVNYPFDDDMSELDNWTGWGTTLRFVSVLALSLAHAAFILGIPISELKDLSNTCFITSAIAAFPCVSYWLLCLLGGISNTLITILEDFVKTLQDKTERGQ